MLRSGNRDLAQQAGEQTREGIYGANQQRLALAGLTRGTDTTGTSTAAGKVTQKDPWGTGLEFGRMLSM